MLKQKKGVIFDYIFVDLNMPGTDGKEFLRKLKSDSDLKHIPVIIYSTTDNEKEIEECMSLGASLFFTKNPNFTSTCQMIKSVI